MRISTRAGRLLVSAVVAVAASGTTLAGVTWLQKLLASDGQADDQFGRAVALQGETLAISAPLDDDGALQAGSVYVYARGTSTWDPAAKLNALDPMDHQVLGLAGLDVDADRVLAGAPGDGASGIQAGAAYLFENNGANWTQSAKWVASDGAPFDAFGWAVAIDGSTAVVSAYLDDQMHNDAGAVYVFEEEAGGWVERVKLTASDAFASDQFGYRLDLAGDTLVIGAPWDDDRGSRSGAVYVFERVAGNWTERTKLSPTDGRAGDEFGHDVSLDGPRLAVGAAFADSPAQDGGAAYVFEGNGTSWTQQTRLEASDAAAFDGFGSRVALDGDVLVVTSEYDDNEWGVDAGAATVFLFCAGSWREETILHAPDGQAADLFAADVALDGDLALLGAARDDEPTHDEGSAYLYRAGRPVGTGYCVSDPNSSGRSAVICAIGSTSVTDQDLSLAIDGLPSGVPGILFFGTDQVQTPFGDGTRCVGGAQQRVWPFVHANADGYVRRALNWNAGYAAFIQAGNDVNFQLWYRDIAAGGAGFNLSNAVEVAFE